MNLTRSRFLRHTLLIAVAAFAGGACTDFSKAPEQLGHLIVVAKDQTGAGVQWIKFTAYLTDRSTAWASVSTSADGSAEFRAKDGGILPQTYIVRFDPVNGLYNLATGETNDKVAQVVLGQTLTVNFSITKGGPGGI